MSSPKLGSRQLNYSLWDGAMDERNESSDESPDKPQHTQTELEEFENQLSEMSLTKQEKRLLVRMFSNGCCEVTGSGFLHTTDMFHVLHCSYHAWFTRMDKVDFKYSSFSISHNSRSIRMFFDEPINPNRKDSPLYINEAFQLIVHGKTGTMFKHPAYKTWCYIADTKFVCDCDTCDGATESSITIYEEHTLVKLLKRHFTEHECELLLSKSSLLH